MEAGLGGVWEAQGVMLCPALPPQPGEGNIQASVARSTGRGVGAGGWYTETSKTIERAPGPSMRVQSWRH